MFQSAERLGVFKGFRGGTGACGKETQEMGNKKSDRRDTCARHLRNRSINGLV